MGILEQEVIQGFIRLCNDGWLQGWHERNGGNLTYRMREEEAVHCHKWFRKPEYWQDMGVCAKEFAGQYFITTGSGKYFRNIALAPLDNIGVVQINDKGNAWGIVWGLEGGGVPTSEFPSHFLNHAVRSKATNGENRVIYHAHTSALIALTYVLPLSAREFTRVLWKSATECPVVFPDGVGVVDWMVPGGAEIAEATSEIMKRYDAAVWAHHGLFCSGPDFDATFGLMHTIEKAADIYIRALSCGMDIRQTIVDDSLRAIAKEFGVELNEEFLDNK